MYVCIHIRELTAKKVFELLMLYINYVCTVLLVKWGTQKVYVYIE